MSYYELTKEGNVFILTMTNGDDDNRFTSDVLIELNKHLDEMENSEGNAAMILTSTHEKTWSTGIHLDWMLSLEQDKLFAFTQELKRTLLRIALLNMPTIACITGNCYAAGAIMASGFDFRLMRQDRGRFCFPEVNIKIPFGITFSKIISQLPNRHALNELALTGAAWGAVECLPKNVVDAIYSIEELSEKAMELAQTMAEKDRTTFTTIKHELKEDLVEMQKTDNIQ